MSIWKPFCFLKLGHGFTLFCLLISSFAHAQHPSLPSPVIPEGFGINIHFTDPQPGEMKQLSESGVRWVRMDFHWETTETAKGVYDFTAYDPLVQALDEYQIKVLFIFAYGNQLYDQGLAPQSEEGRQAFARWTVAAAKHFGGKGYIWEIWNEPNANKFWRPKRNFDAYVALTKEVTQAFQREVPKEALVGPASYRAPSKLFQKLEKAGVLKHWAAATIHPYRWWINPETAGVSYARLRKQLASLDSELPIISGEWGYASSQLGVDETQQAKFLPRLLLHNLSQGIPLSIWYDWKNDGPDPDDNEHNFGIVHQDFKKPKLAFFAAKTFVAQLRGFRFLRRIPLANTRDYVLVFEKQGEKRLAAWTSSAKKSFVVLGEIKGDFLETNYLGDKTQMRNSGESGLAITLESSPKYFIPHNPTSGI